MIDSNEFPLNIYVFSIFNLKVMPSRMTKNCMRILKFDFSPIAGPPSPLLHSGARQQSSGGLHADRHGRPQDRTVSGIPTPGPGQ